MLSFTTHASMFGYPTYCESGICHCHSPTLIQRITTTVPFALPTLPSRKLRPGNKITLTIVETFPPTNMNIWNDCWRNGPWFLLQQPPQTNPLQVTDVRNVSVVEIKLSKDFSRQEMWCFSRIFERFLNVEEFSKNHDTAPFFKWRKIEIGAGQKDKIPSVDW